MPNNRFPLPMVEVAASYTAGDSPMTIAKRYGTTNNTVRAQLKAYGVKLRSLSEAQAIWQKGRTKSPEHRAALSAAKLGKPSPKPPGFSEKMKTASSLRGKRGADHPAWEGGKVPLRQALRSWTEHEEWRNAVLTRDSYTCQFCGAQPEGAELHVHHKKPVMVIFKEFSITTAEQAIRCLALWDVNNGITVCHVCHPKIERTTYVKP